MKKVTKKNNKGFSLVELIVVVLIIGVIGVALAPQIMKWVDTSKKNTDINNGGVLKSAVQAAVAEWQGAGGKMSEQSEAKLVVSGEGVCTATANWEDPDSTGPAKDLKSYLDENMSSGYPKTKYDKEGYQIIIDNKGTVTVRCNADDENKLATSGF